MPPPSDPPPSVCMERLSLEATRTRDYEESSSACSGSLLGNLVSFIQSVNVIKSKL